MNERQRRFVAEFLREPNATLAAERAGYRHPMQQGHRLKSHPEIEAAIAEGQAAITEGLGFDAVRVVTEVARIAFNKSGDVAPRDQLRGLEMLSRHLGNLFPSSTEVTVRQAAPPEHDLSMLTDAELEELIRIQTEAEARLLKAGE